MGHCAQRHVRPQHEGAAATWRCRMASVGVRRRIWHALAQGCIERNGPPCLLEDDLIFSPRRRAPKRRLRGCVRSSLRRQRPRNAAERSLLLYLGADAFVREGAPSLRGQQASWAARAATCRSAQGGALGVADRTPTSSGPPRRECCSTVCRSMRRWTSTSRATFTSAGCAASSAEPELCRQLDPYHRLTSCTRRSANGRSCGGTLAADDRQPRSSRLTLLIAQFGFRAGPQSGLQSSTTVSYSTYVDGSESRRAPNSNTPNTVRLERHPRMDARSTFFDVPFGSCGASCFVSLVTVVSRSHVFRSSYMYDQVSDLRDEYGVQ